MEENLFITVLGLCIYRPLFHYDSMNTHILKNSISKKTIMEKRGYKQTLQVFCDKPKWNYMNGIPCSMSLA